MQHPSKLIVLDIDNTVFNWVEYYVPCMQALADRIHTLTGITPETIYQEARVVFGREGSIEYPFLVQSLPSIIAHYNHDVPRLLTEAVEEGRKAFNAAAQAALIPYIDVIPTLSRMRELYPEVPIVALTDAPRYVAMWKLNKLGLLSFFDAVYGLPDPRIPIDTVSEEVMVEKEILVKHLQKSSFGFAGRIRTLPEDYEKPGVKGLKTVLMDYDMDGRFQDVLWVGDNLRKDVGLGRRLGVHTGWARYGTIIRQDARDTLLQFSPEHSVAKNVSLDPQNQESPQADFVLDSFPDIIPGIERLLFGRG